MYLNVLTLPIFYKKNMFAFMAFIMLHPYDAVLGCVNLDNFLSKKHFYNHGRYYSHASAKHT